MKSHLRWNQIVQEGILKLLLRLQENLGLTYLFITHDISTVQAIADQVVVMNEGKVVEQGFKRVMFFRHLILLTLNYCYLQFQKWTPTGLVSLRKSVLYLDLKNR